VTSSWVPEQSESHSALLDEPRRARVRARFDAIVVPTHRPAARLRYSIDLAARTKTPLIILCSGRAYKEAVVKMAARSGAEAYAADIPAGNPLMVGFRTSADKQLAAANLGRNPDLSVKRNLGLTLARLLGWKKLMFLDDDIYGVAPIGVTMLAEALEGHSISAFIPVYFPDNSVACHANRLSGGKQDVFASASCMGIRCDRDDLAFFPSIYNEDWFFFAQEAASHRIARVGESRQRSYDPYRDPMRAASEELGDLLAEGLFARLDIGEEIWTVDADYWRYFINRRAEFHERVQKALRTVAAPKREEADRAADSIRAAQGQLARITPQLCQTFVRLWRSDLRRWQCYLDGLPPQGSPAAAFRYLGLDMVHSRTAGMNRTSAWLSRSTGHPPAAFQASRKACATVPPALARELATVGSV
jgi:hypothetical protein